MPELETDSKNDFVIEKIKERPINKRKLIRRTVITAIMAVIFGLVACFTFLVLEPVINNWLYPPEEPPQIVFPEDPEELAPEDMLSEDTLQQLPAETPQEGVVLEEEQIQEILSGVNLDLDHYQQLYQALGDYAKQLSRSMVVVTGISSDTDWLQNIQENKNQAFGVIIANNTRELLILADYAPLKQAETLMVTFCNDMQVEARIKQVDTYTNLTVLGVTLEVFPEEFINNDLVIAKMGSSAYRNMEGIPVVALGSPMGAVESVGYGVITAAGGQVTLADANFKLLQTDIVGSLKAGGILFNLQGEMIGVITNNKTGTDVKNVIVAFGITDLKKRIENMSNEKPLTYLGIEGTSVTYEVHKELGIPFGAYVTNVDINSPAMFGGVQKGDIITSLAGKVVENFNDYENILLQQEAGQEVEMTIVRKVQNEYREMNPEVTVEQAK